MQPCKIKSAQFCDDELCWYSSRFVFPFPSKLNAIKFNSIDNSHSLQSSDVNTVLRPLHLTHSPLCSATSYMAAMLRDGGDLDSADRSMLDAESVHERMFRCVAMMMTQGLFSLMTWHIQVRSRPQPPGWHPQSGPRGAEPHVWPLRPGRGQPPQPRASPETQVSSRPWPPAPHQAWPSTQRISRQDYGHKGKGQNLNECPCDCLYCKIVMGNWNFTNGWGYSYKFCPSYSWWGLCLPTPAPDPETGARETPWWGSVLTTLQCFHLRNTQTPKMFKLIPTKSLMALTDYRATL